MQANDTITKPFAELSDAEKQDLDAHLSHLSSRLEWWCQGRVADGDILLIFYDRHSLAYKKIESATFSAGQVKSVQISDPS